MTVEKDPIRTVQKYVVFFDICSSTSILEDLIRSESQQLWRNLLVKMKIFLRREQNRSKFIIYKFIGDGWILLFDESVTGKELFSFLKLLCSEYEIIFNKIIKPVLSVKIGIVGLTFGVEKGSLIRIVMNSQIEYVGRALNVAARLQGSIKDKDYVPQGKVMVSNKAYEGLKEGIRISYKIYKVERNLRNIAGGERYQAKKVCLYTRP